MPGKFNRGILMLDVTDYPYVYFETPDENPDRIILGVGRNCRENAEAMNKAAVESLVEQLTELLANMSEDASLDDPGMPVVYEA